MLLKYICIVVLLMAPVAIAAPPLVNLTSPENNNLTHTENVTFFCNATSSKNIYRVSLYNNFSGTFALNQTRGVMELDENENTTLLCHFDNSYVCTDSEEGAAKYTYSLPSFTSAKFLQGVYMFQGSTLGYSSGNLDGSKSTIEFWINLGFNPGDNKVFLLDFGEGEVDKLHVIIGGDCDNENGCALGEVTTTNIGFSLHTSYEFISFAEADISGWSAGEWHHVAIVWDTSRENNITDIFLDGSNATTHGYDRTQLTPSLYGTLYLGTDVTGTYAAESTFDELRISNTALSAEEINASYTKGIADHRSVLVNFSMTNLPDGEYKWNCLAFSNESETNFSSNSTIRIDMKTPPTVNAISFTPNSTDDVDPGVMLNFAVDVTDMTNVSQVILEYKYGANWMNQSMTKTGDIWNTSLTTYGQDSVYSYRFHVNDTRNIENTTDIMTINVTKDYTWKHTPAETAAYGLIDTTNTAAIIIINNTGDFTLSISLDTNWPLGVQYNTTNSFDIENKTVKSVNVTAKFADHNSVSNMTITITATNSAHPEMVVPQSNTTVVTINSYSVGSYINMYISSYPLAVNQSSAANITMSFNNIGNETANNLAINWSLPSGWINTSGETNSFLNNLTRDNGTIQKTLEVSIGPASSGIVAVCANITKNGNETYGSCVNIQVTCSSSDGVCGAGCTYNNDIDCPSQVIINTGGGSNSGGSSSINIFQQAYRLSLACPKKVDIYRGQNSSFLLTISNPEKKTRVDGIKLFISGYPQALMSISPSMINSLMDNTTRSFIINITVPDYMKYGPYNTSITASGYASKSNTSGNATVVSSTATTIIFVHSAQEGATLELIGTAAESIGELKAAGISAPGLDLLINQSRASIENGDYDTANDNAKKIIETKETAIKAKTSLSVLGEKIKEANQYGIPAQESGKMLALSQSAFDRGDYARSEERAVTGLAVYDAEAGNSVLQAKFFSTALPYSPFILGVLLFIIIVGRKTLSVSLGKMKLSRLSREEKALSVLMKSSQTEFFRDNVVSRKEYSDSKISYEKRLAEIKKEKIDAIEKISRKHGKRAKLMDAMKEAQHERFEKGIMSKKAYNETMRELRKDLAETEKDKMKKGMASLFLPFFMIALLIPVCYAADDSVSASRSIESAASVLQQMKTDGMPIKRANDTLTEAAILYRQGDFTSAISMANYVPALRNLVIEIDGLIDQAEGKIETSKGKFNVSAQTESFNRALGLYNSELFEESKAVLEGVINDIDQMQSESSLQKAVEANNVENMVSFVSKEWKNMLLAAVIALVALAAFLKLTQVPRRKIKMRHLTKEMAKLETAIMEVQKKYFEDKEISRSTYRTALDKYMVDLSDIKKKMAVLGKTSKTD